MLEGYGNGNRNLRYDVLAALMSEHCVQSKATGRCQGKYKSCRFEECPLNGDEDPTNPNDWVRAIVASENASWEKAFKKGLDEARAESAKKREWFRRSLEKAEPEQEKKTIGGWFRKWLTSK